MECLQPGECFPNLKGRGYLARNLMIQQSPFILGNDKIYQRWRTWKLSHAPGNLEDLVVTIGDPANITSQEYSAVVDLVQRANFAVYRLKQPTLDKAAIMALGRSFGLKTSDKNLCADEDAVSAIEASSQDDRRATYIPYTQKAIQWHTDGYYNPIERSIGGLLLHCVRAAPIGGENALTDPEWIYLLLRDQNPQYIESLMAPEAMTIPANEEGEVRLREVQTGPVFFVDIEGNLRMRYTARRRNILWKEDEKTRAAVASLEKLLKPEASYIFCYRLQPGEGLIGNNILHTRTAFSNPEEGQGRLLWRIRYHERIDGTSTVDLPLGIS